MQLKQATQKQGCDYLGRVPKNVKFAAEKILDDGSYLSWIYPDGKSKKKLERYQNSFTRD